MPDFLNPTSYLPPIRGVGETSTDILLDAIDYLAVIYTPQIRGSRRQASRLQSPWSKDLGLESLQEDTFERAFSIRWLTAVIAQSSNWEYGDADLLLKRRALVEKAANLLAACSGTAGAGIILRNFTFPLCSETEISVSVRDLPLDNHDYTTLGAQTWGGACVLSEMIAEKPEAFITTNSETTRVLELGAGTGLVGLAFAKIATLAGRSFEIFLTDFSEPVLRNLETNISSNFPSGSVDRVAISSHLLDWSTFATCPSSEPPFNQVFDLVLGADIIYEEKHAQWIKLCLSILLARDGCFHLIIPLRKTHWAESRTIEAVFSGPESKDFVIASKETFVCEVQGGSDEVDYVYYRIVRCC